MRRILFIISLLLYSCNDYGQLTYQLKLPSKLKENSGIEKISKDGLLWVIEDSGNKDHIYGLNKKGEIIRDINIKNAKNVDWEDLAIDDEKNLYIGDFGNNYNLRKNLTIYKVPNPEKSKGEELRAVKITFNYPEQKKFPPGPLERLYDAEAFIYFNKHLYIFTKNRTEPFNGKTLLYRIPAKPGHHEATLIDSLTSCDNYLSCAITGATISPDNKRIALLSHNTVWIFSDFKTDNFFKGSVEKIPLKHYSQKEGICFENNKTLLISDEDNKLIGRNLYKLQIKN